MVSIILYTSYKGFNFLLSVLPRLFQSINVLQSWAILCSYSSNTALFAYSKILSNSHQIFHRLWSYQTHAKFVLITIQGRVSEGESTCIVCTRLSLARILVVVGFVAENEREIVAECVGRMSKEIDHSGTWLWRRSVDRSWPFGNFQGFWWGLVHVRGSMGVEDLFHIFFSHCLNSISLLSSCVWWQ